MFLLDDILMSPVRGFMMIVKEIHKAALADQKAYAAELTQRLTSLYAQLEAGEITEDEFDEQEERILSMLDDLEGLDDPEEDAEDNEDGEDNEDEEYENEVDEDEEDEDDDGLTFTLLDLPGDRTRDV